MPRTRFHLAPSQRNSGVSRRLIGGIDPCTFERLVKRASDMSTASSRALIRLLAAAFLLLLGSDKDGRTRISEHRDGSSNRGIATANLGAPLATTPVRNDVDAAQPQLLASEANLHHGGVQCAPAPARTHSWLSNGCKR
jgi:hypothetical protein